MALPSSRFEFKNYVLRNLGAPVIKINVADQQVEDRIDEALLYWVDYGMEGTERQFYKYQVTDADRANKYITLPDNVIGAVRCFDLSSIGGSIQNPWSTSWQYFLTDVLQMTSGSMVPYYIAMTNLTQIQQLLIGQQPVRYNRITNRLYLDTDWTRFVNGQFILVECFQVIDPDEYPTMWKDRQLLKLATAYIKRQWGRNMGKFNNIELLGGVTMRGADMYAEAEEEIKEIEQAIIDSSVPPVDMIG